MYTLNILQCYQLYLNNVKKKKANQNAENSVLLVYE